MNWEKANVGTKIFSYLSRRDDDNLEWILPSTPDLIIGNQMEKLK